LMINYLYVPEKESNLIWKHFRGIHGYDARWAVCLVVKKKKKKKKNLKFFFFLRKAIERKCQEDMMDVQQHFLHKEDYIKSNMQ